MGISEYLSNLNRIRLEKRRAHQSRGGLLRSWQQNLLKSGTANGAEQVFKEISKYDAPSTDFENQDSEHHISEVLAKVVCFYLPQFHAIKENDQWWGHGFTEWRNVSRAVPRFEGHYQPRVPRDLGFYDLSNTETLRRQAEMARAAGIAGFSFYYYNFDGRRILEKPVEAFLAAPDIDIEFCITWANENWTRRWDGLEHDVLLRQSYSPEAEESLAQDICRHFSDPRYIRVNGRPLFIIYRPNIVPNFRDWLDRLRNNCRTKFGENPFILMVQGFGNDDPREFGLDGAVEFPPHKLVDSIRPARLENIFDPNFSGVYFDYEHLVQASCSKPPSDFEVIKCVVPAWDNEARKPGRGRGFINSSPSRYEKWLSTVVDMARKRPLLGQYPFVFINAWNEWAEGAYLEPDVHFGHAYLNATRRAVTGTSRPDCAAPILLVGHDAHPHGAQLLLLNIAKILTRQLGHRVAVILLGGGSLLEEYEAVAPTFVVPQKKKGWEKKLWQKASNALGHDFLAICNTTVIGHAAVVLKNNGIVVMSLVHELPNLIRERHLHEAGKIILRHADHVVFPSTWVHNAFCAEIGQAAPQALIKPQGIYQDLKKPRRNRQDILAHLKIPDNSRVVINVGYGDRRKGLDLFAHIAGRVAAARSDVYFVWVGKTDQALWSQLQADLATNPAKERILLTGYQEAPLDYIEAADVFALTSREDPFPSVVMESLSLGVPVIAYQGSGGHCELLDDAANGVLAKAFCVDSFAASLLSQLDQETPQKRIERASNNRNRFNFESYVLDLLKYLQPAVKKISVIVTCHNQNPYIRERLTSIFQQTYPVHEIIVVDDASTDGTADEVESIAKKMGRDIRLVRCPSNSGSAFGNWQRAVEMTTGDLIWIAEGDDSANPKFLHRLAGAMSDDHVFAFANSVQINGAGKLLGESYDFYLKQVDSDYFLQGGAVPAQEFLQRFLTIRNCILNISSVLFRKTQLLHVLKTSHGDIMDFKVAGDWRLYAALLAQAQGRVSYVTASLNVHRRHENTGVTASLDRSKHLKEIQRMHQFVLDLIPVKARQATREQQLNYQAELAKQFNINLETLSASAAE